MSINFSTLSELVDRFNARRDDTALVVFCDDQSLSVTYAQLADEIERVKRGLCGRGIGRGKLVALWAPNSPEWIAAYFGIVCSGAAAVVLDHQSSAESLLGVLAHAEPALLFTTKDLADTLRLQDFQKPFGCMLLDRDASSPDSWQQLDATEVAEPEEPSPADLASLLYTSGTTGIPKAVPLTHGNLCANANALLAASLIGPDDRVLLPLPLHHTYPFTVGLLNALGTGASIVVPAGISGPEIRHAALSAGATALLAVPKLCAALWDGVQAEACRRGRFAAMLFRTLLALSVAVRRATGIRIGKWLFRPVHRQLGKQLELIGCGGAKLDDELAWTLEGLGWTVLTGYGLTETSPVLTFNDHAHARIGTEGRPVAGVELRVAPPGSDGHGEICARGPSVFSGYWKNHSATQQAFTEDGWFRTGDLGWFDDDGYLHIEGRDKELIVLADGKNVFPEQIEKIYETQLLFREVAILEQHGTLAALVVPDEQALRRNGALRVATVVRDKLEEVAAGLPAYERINNYRITRNPLPRTQLGKLKRHLLPAIYDAADEHSAAHSAAPLTDADRQLLESPRGREVWQWLQERYPDKHLNLETSPQLDLQVDSLEWVAITTELEQRFRVVLTGEAVSRILTVRDLVAECDAAEISKQGSVREMPVPEPPGRVTRAVGALIYAGICGAMRLGFRIDVVGADHIPADEPLLIVPNHASYLDPFVIVAALPWRRIRNTYWAGWVGVAFKTPLRRFLSRASNVFPVDPDRDLGTAADTALMLLREGHSVVWFAEGRRSMTGRLGRFESGVGMVLRHAGVAALPTAIVGTFEAWPRNRSLPRLRRQNIRLTFGRAIRFDGTGGDQKDADEIRSALEQSVRQLVQSGADGPEDSAT